MLFFLFVFFCLFLYKVCKPEDIQLIVEMFALSPPEAEIYLKRAAGECVKSLRLVHVYLQHILHVSFNYAILICCLCICFF